MSELELYENALIERNKQEAPTLLIEEFNYLINKAITQYINLVYNRYDINQQSSDDLRWLQKSVMLPISTADRIIHPIEENHYLCYLPNDYLHILNCVVHFKKKANAPATSKCSTSDDTTDGIYSLCRRLTADQYPSIINNAYFKPSYKNPYFYINDTDLTQEGLENSLDTIINPCSDGSAIGITGQPMEIRCGKSSIYEPDCSYVDYLRKPKLISLTWDNVKSVRDNTLTCEFPDYVAYEIINLFSKLTFENASDPRLETHVAINKTINDGTSTSKK